MSAPTLCDVLVMLAAEGASAQALAQVKAMVEAIEAAPRKRSAAALRQARYRDRARGGHNESVTRDVTQASRVTSRVTPPPPPRDNNQPPPSQDLTSFGPPPEAPAEKSRRGKSPKRAIPEGWTPSEAVVARHVERGLSRPAIAAEMEKLTNWAKANAVIRADWDAQADNWLRKAAEYRPTGPPASRPASRPLTIIDGLIAYDARQSARTDR